MSALIYQMGPGWSTAVWRRRPRFGPTHSYAENHTQPRTLLCPRVPGASNLRGLVRSPSAATEKKAPKNEPLVEIRSILALIGYSRENVMKTSTRSGGGRRLNPSSSCGMHPLGEQC